MMRTSVPSDAGANMSCRYHGSPVCPGVSVTRLTFGTSPRTHRGGITWGALVRSSGAGFGRRQRSGTPGDRMRNLFDQYTKPENRLSHALAVCLDEDRALLRGFLAWMGIRPPGRGSPLSVVEQTLPGELPESEDEAERRGLPDIVIYDGSRWCVVVESKLGSPVSEEQLRRHERTLRRRGFERVHRVALTKRGTRVPKGTVPITWSGLYEWLGSARQRGAWPDRLRAYLRAAEIRLVREERLPEGTLTMFDGFPFSPDNPYTYGEAKRLLKLALEELRKDRALRTLGVDPDAPGRPAITGRSGRVVWDFLSLTDRPKGGPSTSHPHLTLAVHTDHLEASVTIPHGVARPVRRRLADLGPEGLTAVNAAILRRARRLIARGASVQAHALQRHYLSQRSPAVTDAALAFRLETSQPRGGGRVKRQPEWVELFAQLPGRKRSNIQFQYRVQLPWGAKGLDTPESLHLIAESWIALKPLLDALRGKG